MSPTPKQLNTDPESLEEKTITLLKRKDGPRWYHILLLAIWPLPITIPHFSVMFCTHNGPWARELLANTICKVTLPILLLWVMFFGMHYLLYAPIIWLNKNAMKGCTISEENIEAEKLPLLSGSRYPKYKFQARKPAHLKDIYKRWRGILIVAIGLTYLYAILWVATDTLRRDEGAFAFEGGMICQQKWNFGRFRWFAPEQWPTARSVHNDL